MSSVDTLKAVEASVAEAELGLGALREGLVVAEAVVEATDRARLTLRGLFKVLLVVIIVAGIVEGVRRSRSPD